MQEQRGKQKRVEQTDNEYSFFKSPDFYGGKQTEPEKGRVEQTDEYLIFEKPRFLRTRTHF